MRILWFSNAIITSNRITGTGSWLHTMASVLLRNGVDLFNITQSSTVKSITKITKDNCSEWIVPSRRGFQSLPSNSIIREIDEIIRTVSPDIIHIWGLEAYWGLLFKRGLIKAKITLLDIQGLYSECARVYMGNLSFYEQLQCIGLKELVSPSLSVFSQKRRFR